jgi:hypothetical protein
MFTFAQIELIKQYKNGQIHSARLLFDRRIIDRGT